MVLDEGTGVSSCLLMGGLAHTDGVFAAVSSTPRPDTCPSHSHGFFSIIPPIFAGNPLQERGLRQ